MKKNIELKGLVPILSPGHGGMVNGHYTTSGKRSPKEMGDKVLYEGAFNRWIINQLIQRCDEEQIPYYHAFPEYKEISPMQTLIVKKDRSDEIYDNNPKTWMLELHANAGRGTGMEGFTSRGFTNADPIAELCLTNLAEDLGEHVLRKDGKDGDLDKEAGFWILRKAKCPVFLFEVGFMDSKKDYDRLWSRDFQSRVEESLFGSIKEMYHGTTISIDVN